MSESTKNNHVSALSFDILERSQYLEFLVSGEPDESGFIELLQSIAHVMRQTGKRRILIDPTAIHGPIKSMVSYRMGILTGEIFSVHARIAAIRPDWEEESFWDTVASNRGAIVKTGRDREELINWLCHEDEQVEPNSPGFAG